MGENGRSNEEAIELLDDGLLSLLDAQRKQNDRDLAEILGLGVAFVESGESNEEASDMPTNFQANIHDGIAERGPEESVQELPDITLHLENQVDGLLNNQVNDTLNNQVDDKGAADAAVFFNSLPEENISLDNLIENGGTSESQDNCRNNKVDDKWAANTVHFLQRSKGKGRKRQREEDSVSEVKRQRLLASNASDSPPRTLRCHWEGCTEVFHHHSKLKEHVVKHLYPDFDKEFKTEIRTKYTYIEKSTDNKKVKTSIKCWVCQEKKVKVKDEDQSSTNYANARRHLMTTHNYFERYVDEQEAAYIHGKKT